LDEKKDDTIRETVVKAVEYQRLINRSLNGKLTTPLPVCADRPSPVSAMSIRFWTGYFRLAGLGSWRLVTEIACHLPSVQ